MSIIRKLYVLVTFTLVLLTVTGCHNIQDNKATSNHQWASFSKSGHISVESGKLFYQRFGKGDPIIVVHGGPGLDQGYLLPQMLELAKDHEVIFYDQRGSGRSLY